jgi:hypothetical protein
MFLPSFSIFNNAAKPLPREYVIHKFFELGFFAQYNPGSNNYSCSCPICREGDTGIGNIKRCFYLPDKDIIYCHRCGASMKPLRWISTVSGESYEDIYREIQENDYDYISLDLENSFNPETLVLSSQNEPQNALPREAIDLSSKLQKEFYGSNMSVKRVLEYIESRRLDQAVNKPQKWFTTIKDPVHFGRLVLPYYDENNKITFYQSRNVSDSQSIRYLSQKGGIKSVFNLNNIDYGRQNYYVFEGPIDSCFVKNGVAIGGINTGESKFSGIQEKQLDKILFLNRIWILDSQHLDEASRTKTEILLNEGESVFLWPKTLGLQYKDFNELCIDKKLNEINESFILENTVTGFSGLLKLKK